MRTNLYIHIQNFAAVTCSAWKVSLKWILGSFMCGARVAYLRAHIRSPWFYSSSMLLASRTLPFALGIPFVYLCMWHFFPRTVRAVPTCLPGCTALIMITSNPSSIPSWYSRRLIDSINSQVREPQTVPSSAVPRQREWQMTARPDENLFT